VAFSCCVLPFAPSKRELTANQHTHPALNYWLLGIGRKGCILALYTSPLTPQLGNLGSTNSVLAPELLSNLMCPCFLWDSCVDSPLLVAFLFLPLFLPTMCSVCVCVCVCVCVFVRADARAVLHQLKELN
jgi:hypothetical protein